MKRPAFQFYPKDWRSDAALRRCSPAARGAWMDVLCVMHDEGEDEYGVLRWPLKEIASVAGIPVKLLQELAAKNVLKGADRNAPDFMHTPTHAGKKGNPICLVKGGDGPCWYSARFVRDEWVRTRQGGSTKFTEDNQPNRSPTDAPNRSPAQRLGDGASSASASASALGAPNASSTPPPNGISTEAGRACLLMRDAGCGLRSNPSNINLLAALAEGVTPETLADTVREGLARAPPVDEPFAWAIKTARNRHAAGPDQTNPNGNGHVRPGQPQSRSKTLQSLENLEADRPSRRGMVGRGAD